MKSLLFTLVLLCGVIDSHAAMKDPKAVSWESADENGNTCFKADMAVQWHVTYAETEKKVASRSVFFSYDNATQLSTVECTQSSAKLLFSNAGQNLTLTFKSDGDKKPTVYSLSSVDLSYTVTNELFPDAANIGDTVNATSKELSLFSTKTSESYKCSIETQFRLAVSEDSRNATNIYVRLIPPTNKTLLLQATGFTKNSTYGNESECFWDMPRGKAPVKTYNVAAKNETCAKLKTALELAVTYTTIHEQSMTTMIPISNMTEIVANESSCGKETTMKLMLPEKIGNVTLMFTKKSAKSFHYGAPVEESVLSSFAFDYDPMTMYFPNHKTMDGATVNVKNATLSEFISPVEMSYKCLIETDVMVTSMLMATFNQTQLQAFDVKNDTFAKASDCQAVPITSTATPITTQPIKPEALQPTAYNRTLKDNKTICLHSYLGLQLTTLYQQKDGNMTRLYFNYDPDNCTTVAQCDNMTATINFTRKGDLDQWIVLTFMKDSSAKQTYLSQVQAFYTINRHFPDAKDNGTKNYTVSGTYFETPSDMSYECSTEADVLMSSSDKTIVRMTGLKIEAFAESEKYKNEQKCFSDMPTPAPTTGTYYINSTTKNSSSVCAAFKLAVTARLSYKQLMDENPKMVDIHVNGSENSPQDGSFGECTNNMTTLTIPMDDGKLNFSFVFTKKNINGASFQFSMTQATLVYCTDSKYFPNHEYIDGGMVKYTNSSLDLFSSDQDHSYKCNKNTTNGIVRGVTMTFANVQVEPFGVGSKDGSFKSAMDCEADSGLSQGARIGILVAIVVVGLLLVGGVSFFLYRKYKQRKLGYRAFD